MKRILLLALLATSVSYSWAQTAIFNGKDLSGWTIYGTDLWYVDDGELVCESAVVGQGRPGMDAKVGEVREGMGGDDGKVKDRIASRRFPIVEEIEGSGLEKRCQQRTVSVR